MSLYAILLHSENLAPRYGLPVGVRLSLRPVRATGQLFATIGTREDHISRVLNPPPLREHELLKWAEAQLRDLIGEWQDPWRRLHFNGSDVLGELAAAGVTSWPPHD